MQVPVQVAFHGLDHSDAVEERVHEKVAKLEQFCTDIVSCRVTITVHHKNTSNEHRKGEPYHVAITLKVPGDDLVVKRSPKEDDLHDHEDVGIALRDAFDAMERQLKDFVERRRTAAQNP